MIIGKLFKRVGPF